MPTAELLFLTHILHHYPGNKFYRYYTDTTFAKNPLYQGFSGKNYR